MTLKGKILGLILFIIAVLSCILVFKVFKAREPLSLVPEAVILLEESV
jgi:hypothetical protein